MLDRIDVLYAHKWYKAMPEWAKHEVKGYREALLSEGRYSPLRQHLTSVLLYNGVLYRGFDQWRSTWPVADPSALVNMSVWPSGKVFFHGGRLGKYDGQTLPFHNESK